MNTGKSALIAGGIALAAIGVGLSGAQAQSSTKKSINWNLAISETAGGHLIGNPAAEAKLTEYVSYTCPHCATFSKTGDPALKLVYIPSGRVSVEYRHVIRDPIDWTVAVLTNCGASEKFALNHSIFLQEQGKWLAKVGNATKGQMQRWRSTNRTAARKAIANDLGFYDIMIKRGYSRLETDKCLANDINATNLAMTSINEAKRMGILGTPSFALNGKLLAETHSWPSLQKRLDAYFGAKKGQ